MSELRYLEYFVAVYRHRSFRIAAEQLGISQSSLTKGVQKLEASMGLQLFNRTTRRVEPTDVARKLLSRTVEVLAAKIALDDEARLLAGGKSGAIRVGAIALAAETVIASSLAQLSRSHPDLEIEVVVGSPDVYRDLAVGECDVVVGDEANFLASSHAAVLKMTPLCEEELVFIHRAGHPVASGAVDRALTDYPLAIPSRYFSENRLFEANFPLPISPNNPRYRLNSLSACLSLAASSNTITLAPKSLMAGSSHAFPSQGLQIALDTLTQDWDLRVRLVMVTAAKNAPTPAIKAFHQACIA